MVGGNSAMTSAEENTTFTMSHWGAYRVETRDGRVAEVTPFERDPEPSPLIEAMPGVVHHSSRIVRPMVREGWLEDGHASDTAGRGTEPFVEVSWDDAMELVAGELSRVKAAHGNEAFYPVSGWGVLVRFTRPRVRSSDSSTVSAVQSIRSPTIPSAPPA